MVTPGSGAPYALFSVDLSFQLADLTQGGTFSGGTVTLSNEIFSGSYSQGHTGLHRSTYYNVTLNATHSYQFVAQIQINVGVFAPPGSNSASAFVNMGSGGGTRSWRPSPASRIVRRSGPCGPVGTWVLGGVGGAPGRLRDRETLQ